jgi:hypothetical protein
MVQIQLITSMRYSTIQLINKNASYSFEITDKAIEHTLVKEDL